jgi:UV DNA damage endonuclease
MKVGYVSTNYSLCRADRTFRLSSLTVERAREVGISNLECLMDTLKWNVEHGIYFFRISSNTIPFASHPKMLWDWRTEVKSTLEEIGDFIKDNGIRISMHPGQYVVINSERKEVIDSSFMELKYHADLLDLMGVEGYIQIHLGSSKGDAIGRFVGNFFALPENVRKRLAIENDDKVFNVSHCLHVSSLTGVPVVFDNLHHKVNGNNDTLHEALEKVRLTWKGRPMVDYSEGNSQGVHSDSITDAFERFAEEVDDVDIMLEVRDKERSALKAVEILRRLGKLD